MLQIGIYDSSAGSLYLDISPRASGVQLVNGEHGFGTLTAFVRMALWEAFMLYDRPGLPMVRVTEYGLAVWEGRLEDVAIVAGGVRITAFGYWRALSDIPYTALWSKTDLAGWRLVTSVDLAGRAPQMYVADQINRLYLTCVKGAVYGNATNVGGWTYAVPNQSGTRTIVAISFDYAMLLPVNWRMELVMRNDTFSSSSVILNTAATGILQTGTITQTFTGQVRVDIGIYNLTGANSTPAGETGANFCQITNIRIKTTLSAGVYADEIAGALAVSTNATNPDQIAATTALIQSPGVDLHDEIYADAYPADILDRLARLGDNSTPVSLYEAGVWEGQLLTFQKRGATARVWYVDVSALELERTIDALYNSVYATYQEAGGRTLRSGTVTDSDSRSRYGLLRQRVAGAATTSAAQAGTLASATLQDGKDPRPRIAITIDHIYDAAGSPYPLWYARAWDTVKLRNLPLTISSNLERLRTFRIVECRYNIDTDTLTLVPESRLPSLGAQAAGQAWAGQPNVYYADPLGGGNHGAPPNVAGGGAVPTGGGGGNHPGREF